MSNWNPWKVTAIGMALVVATAVISGLVVANWNGSDKPSGSQPADALASQPAAPAPPTAVTSVASNQSTAPAPSAADVQACDTYARTHVGDSTVETVKDALIGAVAGAGMGAAGGAMAGGGKGAGRGAGIGGAVGAAAGTLYGLNEGRSHDARYVQAYRGCMKARGYTG